MLLNTTYLPIMLLTLTSVFCARNPEPVQPPANQAIKTETVVNNREIIWGMDFLPDGDLLFTEKKGLLTRASKNDFKLTPITGIPSDIEPKGQGGLLDIRVHPKYTENGWIYMNYVASGGYLTLVRFKLNGNQATSIEKIFQTKTPDTWGGHFGGRIVFDKAGYLYLSIGEGGSGTRGGANSTNLNAQDTKSDWGKVHRMTDDGKVPADNPVLPGNDKPTTVFTYGHRNPQGLAYDPVNNRVWETEHGPKGGDELNLIEAGKNYGWPLVSYGINYDGSTISEDPKKPGIEDPKTYWVPSKAPSGLCYVTSDKFPGWKGSLLSGALAHQYLARITLEGTSVTTKEKLLEKIGRVRNVKQGPDGFIYLSVEGPGRIIRVTPE